MAVVATSTPKRHGFSIESLIGRRDDSPRRQIPSVVVPRPEDFSSTRPEGDASRESPNTGRDGESPRDRLSRLDSSNRDGAFKDTHKDYVREFTSSSPRDSISSRDHHHLKDSRERDLVRENFLRAHHNSRDSVVRVMGGGGERGGVQHEAQHARDSFIRDNNSMRPRSRQGTLSPSSTTTDEEMTRHTGGGRRTSSPADVSPRLQQEKSLSSSSPEAENRLVGWSSDDFKHLLGTGAFHHQGHHHHHHTAVPGMESSGMYPPLRVCNRSLSAAMSSLLPHQFPGGLPGLNPLSLYNLHRDLAASAPHHATHPLLAARYPGFVHPRYQLGPPPGLLFHPYRKPKRNRTAFSPSQLLQLEQAFEKNHYVVGQERKTLAGKLQLTETQVKVWFQNRRTKHKRMKAEEEATGGGVTSGDDVSKTGDNCDSHVDMKSDAEDHELLDDDICTSDEELSVTEDS